MAELIPEKIKITLIVTEERSDFNITSNHAIQKDISSAIGYLELIKLKLLSDLKQGMVLKKDG